VQYDWCPYKKRLRHGHTHKKNMAIYKPMREVSEEINRAGTLILDFQLLELRGNKFLLFSLPSL
jgi:hypothetical protein